MIIVGGYDLETTGLLTPEHRIIEVAVGVYEWDPSTKVAREIDRLTQRIDPQRSIDAKAREVHGIYESDLVGKPTFDVFAPTLVRILDKCDVVVAHNGMGFDFPFTVQELERVRSPIPDFEPVDTMLDCRWATPFGKAPSLKELCWASGVIYDENEAHAADYDERVMMQSFFYGLRRGVLTLSTI